MSCSSIDSKLDLKAYLLGEMPQREKATLDAHVRACTNCREELERLRLTQTALLALEEEEIPQRIAFVSDKVFEPRWWQRIWHSGPAMGFASASVLALAILVHAFARPVGMPAASPVNTAQIDVSKVNQRIEQDVNARIAAAVTKAVADTEARQNQKLTKMLEAAELQRRGDLAAVQQAVRYYDQQMSRLMVASNDVVRERSGQ